LFLQNIGKMGEFRAEREYTHTLRLKSELFDLRVGYANSNNASVCSHCGAIFTRGRISSATNILRLAIGSRAAAALRRGCELQQYGGRPPHCGVS
jgi:hypothetical protein